MRVDPGVEVQRVGVGRTPGPRGTVEDGHPGPRKETPQNPGPWTCLYLCRVGVTGRRAPSTGYGSRRVGSGLRLGGARDRDPRSSRVRTETRRCKGLRPQKTTVVTSARVRPSLPSSSQIRSTDLVDLLRTTPVSSDPFLGPSSRLRPVGPRDLDFGNPHRTLDTDWD